ncbi:MAG: phosphate ABC transporter substrate-binding protein PstS [Chloroflexi bacterium]|nr:phosphate ABC transporter substrate-binding protein PstS [Chloroflexota bacterium]
MSDVHIHRGTWSGLAILGLITSIIFVTIGCTSGATPPSALDKGSPGGAASTSGQRASLTGAGATFPYPLYSKWFDEYRRSVDPNVTINYQSIGSGGGKQQITQRTVDFGASDGPMSDEELQRAPGILHIPTVAGAVVIAYNVQGLDGGLKLTPEAIAGIFLGQVKKWNDPLIAAQNPEVRLPNADIAVVRRSDGSGTTNILTDYLSSVSLDWKSKVGAGTSVNWPVGLGAKGNEGVAGQVKQLPNSVGYVELAYAEQTRISYAEVQNKAGNFIQPTVRSTTAAAAGADIPADLRASIVDSAGADAYPIAGFTWLLVYQEQTDYGRGQALVNFLWWALHDGQKFAADLSYAPLPDNVVRLAEEKVRSITFQGNPLLTVQ